MKELQVIQSKLVAPKNQTNSFGGYKYRSCEDILTALKPLLDETKTTLTLTDDIVQVGDRIYVKAIATLMSEDGERSVTTTAFARESESKPKMDSSQVTGSSSSYARKYALNGLFCIDDSKDADYLNTNKEFTETPQQNTDDAELENAIKDIMMNSKDRATFEKMYRKYKKFHASEKFLLTCEAIAKKYPKQK